MHSACGQLCGKLALSHGSCEDLQSLQHRQVFVKSMVSEVAESEDGSTVTQFIFRCCANSGNDTIGWEVKRQEKDFQKLHSHLKKKGSVPAEFPSKSILSVFGSSFLMRRREDAFKNYLNAVLNHCNDDQCVLLCKFLRVNKQAQLCKPPLRTNDMSCPKAAQNSDDLVHSAEDTPGRIRKQGLTKTSLASVPYSSLHFKSQDDSSEFAHIADTDLLMVPYSSSDEDSQYEKMRSKRRTAHVSGSEEQPPSEAKPSAVECCFCSVEGVEHGKKVYSSSISPHPASRLSKAELAKQQKALLEDLKQRQQGRLASEGSCGVAGIGLVFVQSRMGQSKGMVIVEEIVAGSSAESNGTISAGDVLISVDGVLVTSKDLTQIRSMIVGNVGTTVTLELERGGQRQHESRRYSVTLRRGQCDEHDPRMPESPFVETQALPMPEGHPQLQIPSQASVVRVVYPFSAARPHELSLVPGDAITVLRQHSSGWWEGRAPRSGLTGWFPSNHVQALAPSSGSNSPQSEPDSARSKGLSAESSLSAKSLSLRSTVHGDLSAGSSDSGASHSPKEKDSNVEEVCSWLKTVDLKDAVDSKRGSLGLRGSFGVSGVGIR